MNWTFPEIKTTRDMKARCDKVNDEVEEYLEADTPDKRDKEAIDIYHAAETHLRGQFKGREEVLDQLILFTIKKNDDRGYYTKDCF